MEIYIAKYMYPWKNVLGIHMEAKTHPKTTKNLNIQHPSWNIDAPVFLGKTAKKTRKWKHPSTKLILVTKDIPTQAAF
jgi:hypothetical protein